ncbi:hypothetical protein NKR23_g1454 [Pleurostoma richardsiae]|uniref:Uncharacterized protein n=1 Tax=Pleurostoma richardsiae TaxID=41990 RepID=A0AA38S4A4_9PEZI|nr:hypothetical protein NKR23_g1454 [Pleurostoma richardsiae]
MKEDIHATQTTGISADEEPEFLALREESQGPISLFRRAELVYLVSDLRNVVIARDGSAHVPLRLGDELPVYMQSFPGGIQSITPTLRPALRDMTNLVGEGGEIARALLLAHGHRGPAGGGISWMTAHVYENEENTLHGIFVDLLRVFLWASDQRGVMRSYAVRRMLELLVADLTITAVVPLPPEVVEHLLGMMQHRLEVIEGNVRRLLSIPRRQWLPDLVASCEEEHRAAEMENDRR